jgi:hypothetical protein
MITDERALVALVQEIERANAEKGGPSSRARAIGFGELPRRLQARR